MNKGITVKDLYALCKEEIKRGNADKHIVISDDDEGNGFHTLFYGFCTETHEYADMGMFHDRNNPDETIILG